MADLKILISRKVLNTLTQNLEHEFGKSIFFFYFGVPSWNFCEIQTTVSRPKQATFSGLICETISKIKGDALQQGNIAIDVHTKIITIIQQIRRLDIA